MKENKIVFFFGDAFSNWRRETEITNFKVETVVYVSTEVVGNKIITKKKIQIAQNDLLLYIYIYIYTGIYTHLGWVYYSSFSNALCGCQIIQYNRWYFLCTAVACFVIIVSPYNCGVSRRSPFFILFFFRPMFRFYFSIRLKGKKKTSLIFFRKWVAHFWKLCVVCFLGRNLLFTWQKIFPSFFFLRPFYSLASFVNPNNKDWV